MQTPRRQFLQLAAGAGALPALSRIARAQAYYRGEPARVQDLVAGQIDLLSSSPARRRWTILRLAV